MNWAEKMFDDCLKIATAIVKDRDKRGLYKPRKARAAEVKPEPKKHSVMDHYPAGMGVCDYNGIMGNCGTDCPGYNEEDCKP